MGGPGAGVLLRNILTKHQEDELEVWLRSITNHLEKEEGTYEFWLNEEAFPGTVSRCLFYLSVEDTQKRWDVDEKRQVKELLGYLPTQSIGVSSGCNQDEDHTTLGQFVLHLAKVYDGLIDMEGAITPPLKPVNRERLANFLAAAPSAQGRGRKAYMQARLDELKNSLPPGKTMLDLMREQHTDPNSPLKAIMADVEARFGPVIPSEFSMSARRPPLDEISTYVRAMPGSIYEIEYIAAGHRWISHIVDTAFLQAWMEHPRFHMIK